MANTPSNIRRQLLENHIREGERIVELQRQVVRCCEESGECSEAPRQLLEKFESTLDQFVAARDCAHPDCGSLITYRDCPNRRGAGAKPAK